MNFVWMIQIFIFVMFTVAGMSNVLMGINAIRTRSAIVKRAFGFLNLQTEEIHLKERAANFYGIGSLIMGTMLCLASILIVISLIFDKDFKLPIFILIFGSPIMGIIGLGLAMRANNS